MTFKAEHLGIAIVILGVVTFLAQVPFIWLAGITFGVFLVGLLVLAILDFVSWPYRFFGHKNKSGDFPVKKTVDEKPVEKMKSSVFDKPDGNIYIINEPLVGGSIKEMTDPYRDTTHPEWENEGGNSGLRFDDGTPIFKENT